MPDLARGKFIVIEGADGAGTTTQSKSIVQTLKDEGIKAEWTCEPTDKPIGRLIRKILQKHDIIDGCANWRPPPQTLAMLFMADRIDHTETFIKPALRNGVTVVSDRYIHSTLVYQSLALDGHVADPFGWLMEAGGKIFHPDLTLVLDVDLAVMQERRGRRSGEQELFEEEAFQKLVVEKYRNLSTVDQTWIVDKMIQMVSGDAPIEEVTGRCMELVRDCLGKED